MKEWTPMTPISHKYFKVVPPKSWINTLSRVNQDAQDFLSVSIPLFPHHLHPPFSYPIPYKTTPIFL